MFLNFKLNEKSLLKEFKKYNCDEFLKIYKLDKKEDFFTKDDFDRDKNLLCNESYFDVRKYLYIKANTITKFYLSFIKDDKKNYKGSILENFYNFLISNKTFDETDLKIIGTYGSSELNVAWFYNRVFEECKYFLNAHYKDIVNRADKFNNKIKNIYKDAFNVNTLNLIKLFKNLKNNKVEKGTNYIISSQTFKNEKDFKKFLIELGKQLDVLVLKNKVLRFKELGASGEFVSFLSPYLNNSFLFDIELLKTIEVINNTYMRSDNIFIVLIDNLIMQIDKQISYLDGAGDNISYKLSSINFHTAKAELYYKEVVLKVLNGFNLVLKDLSCDVWSNSYKTYIKNDISMAEAKYKIKSKGF